jgi:hypothetical protein
VHPIPNSLADNETILHPKLVAERKKQEDEERHIKY